MLIAIHTLSLNISEHTTLSSFIHFINPAFTAADVSLSSRHTIFIEAFAVVTMAIYLGFVHLLGVLLLGSFYSRTCLLLLIGGFGYRGWG
jgi:hypothetical protein